MQVPKRAPPAVRPRVSVAVSGGGDGGDAAHWDGTLPTASSATTDEEQSAMDRQFTLLPLVQSNQSDKAQSTRHSERNEAAAAFATASSSLVCAIAAAAVLLWFSGAISSLCVWQSAVFIGTVTGTLMR